MEEEQIVVFNLDEEALAFEINFVKEIVNIPPITPVPRSGEFIEGVINLRGQISTVLNLKKRLGMDDLGNGKNGKIIILEKKDQAYGVMADGVLGVFKISQKDIQDPSSVFNGEEIEFIKGIVKLDDQLVILLEPDALISREEIGVAI